MWKYVTLGSGFVTLGLWFGAGSSWAGLLPPLTALVLAIAARQILIPLLLGVGVGAWIHAGYDPVVAAGNVVTRYLLPELVSSAHLAILVFTAALLGLVRVATASGGIQGLVDALLGASRAPAKVQRSTVFMGLAVFFDDYANTAVVGATMRSVFDQARISRAKLAYLIDSTAAPVAGLAVVSTWIGAEVSMMQEAAAPLVASANGYTLFFEALPYRFYCIAALGMVIGLVWSGREFGPMLSVERSARAGGFEEIPSGGSVSTEVSGAAVAQPRAIDGWLPIVTVIGLILLGVYGAGARAEAGALPDAAFLLGAFVYASDLMDGNYVLYVFAAAALTGSGVAILLPWSSGRLTARQALAAWWQGVVGIAPTLAVLVLAWSLSRVCHDVGTARWMVEVVRPYLTTAWVPAATFGVAALVAFSTGTSWGTMAIMMPVAAQLGYAAGDASVMVICMAAVLDGAILGDHCSPISDTTILSSACAGCDHLQHVRTQLPYALAGASAAGLGGYFLVNALGAPLIVGYATIALVVVAWVRGVGRPVLVSAADGGL